MDTRSSITSMPAHEDDDDCWRAWADRHPSVRAINLVCTEVSADTATFVLDEVPFPANPNGAVNGGVIALAADQVMGVLAARGGPTGSAAVTAALTVHFHAPAFAPVTFRARAIPGGRSVLTIEVVAHGADGRRYSTATGTMAIRPLGRISAREEL